MRRQARSMRAFVERTLILLIASGVMGCAADEESLIAYSPREEIPLGIIDLSVTDWDELSGTRSPLGSLRPPEGEKPVVVFIHWSGLGEYSEFDRRRFVEAFLSDRLTLVDSDGFEYDALHAMPEDLYRMSGRMSLGSAPPTWVVVFWAWVDSEGYSLRIEHPNPTEGGFHVATVDLL